MENIYLVAWEILYKRLEEKTGWGREEIKKLMLECLIQAGKQRC